MYQLILTTKFRKDLKKAKKNKETFSSVASVLTILESKGVEHIPAYMKPHKLKGNYKNNWECHIKSDLLIIWMQIENPKEITLIRLGSHSDIFR